MSDETEKLPPCTLSKVESLEEYFSLEHGPDGECRPCRLQPLASLYLGVLEKAGEEGPAAALSEAYESGDILTIAKAMDSIRASAKAPVRKDLEELDCFTQSFKDE